ncbi:MAG: hypothetical protein DMF50_06775 [Acidobacteria bacterium]|nr:MAG: hypothetical protein DMF50_06775 [Acidobacteriota bacterium]
MRSGPARRNRSSSCTPGWGCSPWSWPAGRARSRRWRDPAPRRSRPGATPRGPAWATSRWLERAWGGVLLDPPRAGLPAESARALAEAGPGRLVYVSCDPATLSRDLKILAGAGRYGVDAVTPCDLFPQTHHVECVVSLSRRG